MFLYLLYRVCMLFDFLVEWSKIVVVLVKSWVMSNFIIFSFTWCYPLWILFSNLEHVYYAKSFTRKLICDMYKIYNVKKNLVKYVEKWINMWKYLEIKYYRLKLMNVEVLLWMEVICLVGSSCLIFIHYLELENISFVNRMKFMNVDMLLCI